MRILFHSVGEFMDELKKDLRDERADIHRRILRITRRYQTSVIGGRHLFVEASYQVSNQVIGLEMYCGQLGGPTGTEPSDAAVEAKSEKLIERLMEVATTNALEVRGGAAVAEKVTT